MSEELRKTIMDAMRSVSERADEFKACCATFDGEWPDAEDKAIYDAEVALVERLRVALASISDAAQAPVAWANVREDGVIVGLSQHQEDIANWQNPQPLFYAAPVAANAEALGAFDQLKAALLADDEYAWSWHCNLAMPIMDSIHCSPVQANKAGADLMQYLFGIDVRKFKEWHHDEPMAAPLMVEQRRVIVDLLNVARETFNALDDSEEREGADGREHVINSVCFDFVCQALDRLEQLPDDKPGQTLSAAGKAEWALRALLAAPTPTVAKKES